MNFNQESYEMMGSQSQFRFTKDQLKRLMHTRDVGRALQLFQEKFGDDKMLCSGLNSNKDDGIHETDAALHRTQFGENIRKTERARTSILSLIVTTLFENWALVAVFVLCLLSFGVSFLQEDESISREWCLSLSSLVLVLIILSFDIVQDILLERTVILVNRLLRKEALAAKVFVTRNGLRKEIPVTKLVVGDVVSLYTGDVVPADGIIITAKNLEVDETAPLKSGVKMKKKENDPFLYAGSVVRKGSTKLVVTVVGKNTVGDYEDAKSVGIPRIVVRSISRNYGRQNTEEDEGRRRFRKRRRKTQQTTIEEEVGTNDNSPDHVDSDRSNGVLDSLDSRGDVINNQDSLLPQEDTRNKAVLTSKLKKITNITKYLGVSVVVFCLLLFIIRFTIEIFVRLDLHWTWSYLKDYVEFAIISLMLYIFIRPRNQLLIVKRAIAYSLKGMLEDNLLFRNQDACELMGNITCICSNKTGVLTQSNMEVKKCYIAERMHDFEKRRSMSETLGPFVNRYLGRINTKIIKLLQEGIAINSEYATQIYQIGSKLHQVGDQTDCALLHFIGEICYRTIRNKWPEEKVDQTYTFDSNSKFMGTFIETENANAEPIWRLHVKGAVEIIFNSCSYILDADGQSKELTNEMREQLKAEFKEMSLPGLRMVCLAFRDFPHKPNMKYSSKYDNVAHLTFISVIAMSNPIRTNSKSAVESCQAGGITIRMLTGDDMNAAYDVAVETSVFDPKKDDLAMDSRDFNQSLSRSRGQYNVMQRLKVLSRAHFDDKECIVTCVTGFFPRVLQQHWMPRGQQTSFCKTTASIASSKLSSGGDIFGIQLQNTCNISSHLPSRWCWQFPYVQHGMPFKSSHLLWLYFIVNCAVIVILMVETPSKIAMQRTSLGWYKPLLSRIKLRYIIGHGDKEMLFDVESGRMSGVRSAPSVHMTLLFNVTVLITVFNAVNTRKVYAEKNVTSEMQGNQIKWILFLIISIALQVVFVELFQGPFNTTSLHISEWLWCFAIALSTLLFHQILILIPISTKTKITEYNGNGRQTRVRFTTKPEGPEVEAHV
ncbi:plasma membrane calcium-transporting ATPase 1-like [Anneissia japonica]|uniref:plasma membrane calcium-transporting ATPase 1-like n=1 Tax=Anneissia japonica TaxID=1529436 RepID=UPI001425A058|nr:plasma membrane calcium-transporting ATPase 1-like [Anneissia japonica]